MLARDIALGIKEREGKGLLSLCKVHPGPADNSIFDVENGVCIANDMSQEGVKWTTSNKSPGSRKNGFEVMRSMLSEPLKAAKEQRPMEAPGMFVFNTCIHFTRTIPTLPRSTTDPEDVNSKAEDHVYDETRYRALDSKKTTRTQEI